MIPPQHPSFFRLLALYLLLPGALFAVTARAQLPTATLTGTVTDPSNALVINATVTLHPTTRGLDVMSTTSRSGRFRVSLQPDVPYIAIVKAAGFAIFTSGTIQLAANKARTFDVRLKVEGQTEQVTVDESDTDPNHNGDSLTLKGDAIDRLPLDPAELLQQLQALSGGPMPELWVDGFSGGTLPPRDTIIEIRINQNPYSTLYDTEPGNGRIEIFTKPGTGKLHGDFYTYGNAAALNTENPFATNEPSYYSYSNEVSIGGPINKHLSFFTSGGQRRGQDNALINAQTLDPNTYNPIYLHEAVSAPSSAYNFSLRLDATIGKKSTINSRYFLSHASQANGGIGQLSLAAQAFSGSSTNQVLQVGNSQILSPRMVNDTRFQYTRSRARQLPNSTLPTILVAGAFVDGGNSAGESTDNQDRFELQNYVSASKGKQFFNFGGRLRVARDANDSRGNYNGTYTFACLTLGAGCPSNAYQPTVRGIAGGGASQFSITQGNPNVVVTLTDTGLFFQDDWKTRKNVTLSGGLRFETQNHISDHADWAPRIGFAWLLDAKSNQPANYTLRGGAGIFYHRFTSANVMQAARLNGVTQQQVIVTNPQFYLPNSTPTAGQLAYAQTQSTTYQISPTFHAPYYISATLSIERRLGNIGTVTASWLTSRGDHTQEIRNINAPLSGTYNPAVPTSGVRPNGSTQNIYEYGSEGVFRSNRLTTNFYLHFRERVFAYGSYQLLSQSTDANDGFVSNSYDLGADYGRSPGDIRHQASVGGSIRLPLDFRVNSFVRVQSGTPFNITVGQDLNGDSIFNDRPAFATDLTRPSVVTTAYGTFDTSPIAGQTIIPINYGHGPGLFVVNLIMNKTVSFGPALRPPAGMPAPILLPGQKAHVDRRFSIDFGVDIQNLFNQVNLANPVGTLNSPLFGKSIALANQSASANRIVELSGYLRF